MKTETKVLLDELRAQAAAINAQARQLRELDPVLLRRIPAPGCWSVIQVLDHLCYYNRYYLPALDKALTSGKAPAQLYYRSGWLGNYFVRMMAPGQGGQIRNKMSAPKDSRPAAAPAPEDTLRSFISQQEELIRLLDTARLKDIGSIRVPISLAKWLRLKAGDTFRFVLAHQQRHFVQIAGTLKAQGI